MTRNQQRRLLAGIAGMVVMLAAYQWFFRPIVDSRRQLASSISRSERRLQELMRLASTYQRMRAQNAQLEKYLGKRPQGFTLFAFLEALASRDGLKPHIEFMRPTVRALDDTHQEERVEMRLSGVSLASLIPYLYHVETAPEQLRISRLAIRVQPGKQSLLEVRLVVVAYGARPESGRGASRKLGAAAEPGA